MARGLPSPDCDLAPPLKEGDVQHASKPDRATASDRAEADESTRLSASPSTSQERLECFGNSRWCHPDLRSSCPLRDRCPAEML